MILQALHGYYHRRCADADPARRLPAFGLEHKEIGFILELGHDGTLRQIVDTRRQAGKKVLGAVYLVPKGVKKASGIAANLLWDNAEYVLGLPDAKKLEAARAKHKADNYLARLTDMLAAFRARIEALPVSAQTDPGVAAVLAFLEAEPGRQASAFSAYADIAAGNPVLTFRLIDDVGTLVSQRPDVAPHVVAGVDDDEGEEGEEGADGPAAAPEFGMCLVTGDNLPTARLHTAIKGVWGAQSAGANVVSFNLKAFNSYAKAQGSNAPVSQAAAFAYSTALNALLARGSPQRMQVGDASTVFWAQQADPLEEALAEMIGGDDDPDAHTQQVKALFDAVRTGAFGSARGSNRFYVLGLAPNAARISVRFWHEAPLADIAQRVVAWFDDLDMIRESAKDAEYPSLFKLLTAVALQGKADNIPPRLGGDLVRSIFTGTPYPTTWLMAAVQRCRAERQVGYLRAAAIRAVLNRNTSTTAHHREIKSMLDDNPSPAYRMGRLFATLEKIQEEASPGLNATIRERYYGAASSTPVAVFTTLLRLKNHHLAKIASRGRVVNFEKLLAEIIGGIDGFPTHLNLPQQGLFAVGYYHQRQDFFGKREAAAAADATTTS
jgi:CRISPR-associated protein Csd1